MATNLQYLSALKEEKRREILQLVKYTKILTAESSKIIFLVDLTKKETIYASDNDLFTSLDYNTIEDMFERNDLNNAYKVINRIVHKEPKEKEVAYLSFDIAVKTTKNNIILNVHIVPLKYSQEGNFNIVMCTMSPSSKKHSGNYILSLKGLPHVYKYDFVFNKWLQNTTTKLTPSEKLLIRLFCQGYSVKDIATNTSRSEDTIKESTKKLYRKLDVTNRAEAIVYCLNNNML